MHFGPRLLLNDDASWSIASPSQDTQYEVSWSVSLSPLDGMLVHHRIPGMECVGVVLLLPDGMLVHHRIPSIK